MPDSDSLWNQALNLLKLQMPRATFDAHLTHSYVGQVEAQRWTIAAKNRYAREWLEGRLASPIRRTLTELLGYEPELCFTVAPEPDPALPPDSSFIPHPSSFPPTPRSEFVSGINFVALWFEKGGDGFDRLAKYWSRFWRAYLNRLNSRAYSVWEYLLLPDKSDQAKPPYWTRPRAYQIKPMAEILGCSPGMITGGFKQCSVFDRALAEGTVLSRCCEAHCPHEMRTNQHGQPQCRFWRTGALEVLYKEGLLAIRVSGDSAKDTWHHLQIWRLLPLLSPWQAQVLPKSEWRAHQDWIEAQGKSFNAEEWHNYTARRMVFEMELRDEGRAYHDTYQPNPLLSDSTESDSPGAFDLSDSTESDNPYPVGDVPHQLVLLDSTESDSDDE